MGYIDHLRKKGACVQELSSCCPFCGSACALLFTAPFGAWHVVCDDNECGADFMFFNKETDQFKTAKAFSRRDGIKETVKAVMETFIKEHESEIVVPHCVYSETNPDYPHRCIDYPHCAGCGAAEWKEVNTDATEKDQGDLREDKLLP